MLGLFLFISLIERTGCVTIITRGSRLPKPKKDIISDESSAREAEHYKYSVRLFGRVINRLNR